MGYSHRNKKGTTYYLNCKDVTLKSTGRVQRIYYFSKDQRSTACDMPSGKSVVENDKTGASTLIKMTKKIINVLEVCMA